MTVLDQKIAEDLKMLKKVHDVYLVVDEEKKGRLLDACKPIINRLVAGGMDRIFVETLVVSGKDFIDSLYGDGTEVASEYDAQLIFS